MPSISAPHLSPLELGWSLRGRTTRAYNQPLAELQARAHAATDPSALADVNDPGQFQRACMIGLAAISDLARDPELPAPVPAALHELPAHYQELLNLLQPAGQSIMAACPDFRNLQRLEGIAGLLHKSAQAANPSTPIGVAAIGGATIGTLLFPGIGTAVGGALGVWLGGTHNSNRERAILLRFAGATKLMWTALDDVYRAAWNLIARALEEKGGPALADAAFFETAAADWSRLRETLNLNDLPGERPRLETFRQNWGPHPEVLYLLSRSYLPPAPLDLEAAARVVRLHGQMYPKAPESHELAGRLALEQGDFPAALEAARRALGAQADHVGGGEVCLDASAAAGQGAEAAATAAASNKPTARLFVIRGLMRAGQRDEAVAQVRAWVKASGTPALIVRHLALFAPTAPLAADLPELAAVPEGVDGRLQAIVEEYLHGDGGKSFVGQQAAVHERLAHDAILHLQAGERLLFLHDWSLFHNAKSGLAMTNRRLVWKAGWADPVVIDLSKTTAARVKVEQSTLHVGAENVDVRDGVLAAALGHAVREMIDARLRDLASGVA